MLHEVIGRVVGGVADALEGPAGRGLIHGGVVVGDEGTGAVVVFGAVASPEEEGEGEERGEEGYAADCTACDGADVLLGGGGGVCGGGGGGDIACRGGGGQARGRSGWSRSGCEVYARIDNLKIHVRRLSPIRCQD